MAILGKSSWLNTRSTCWKINNITLPYAVSSWPLKMTKTYVKHKQLWTKQNFKFLARKLTLKEPQNLQITFGRTYISQKIDKIIGSLGLCSRSFLFSFWDIMYSFRCRRHYPTMITMRSLIVNYSMIVWEAKDTKMKIWRIQILINKQLMNRM